MTTCRLRRRIVQIAVVTRSDEIVAIVGRMVEPAAAFHLFSRLAADDAREANERQALNAGSQKRLAKPFKAFQL